MKYRNGERVLIGKKGDVVIPDLADINDLGVVKVGKPPKDKQLTLLDIDPDYKPKIEKLEKMLKLIDDDVVFTDETNETEFNEYVTELTAFNKALIKTINGFKTGETELNSRMANR